MDETIERSRKKARAEARMASSIEERVASRSINASIMNADNIDHQNKDQAMRAIDWVKRREHPFAGERFVGSDDAVLKMTTNEENLLHSQESSKMVNDSNGKQVTAVAAMVKVNSSGELDVENGKEEDLSTVKH